MNVNEERRSLDHGMMFANTNVVCDQVNDKRVMPCKLDPERLLQGLKALVHFKLLLPLHY